MTLTEKARRSEALYYDNHNITRRTLCDRIVNLESDMEEVKSENSNLREENERFIIKLNAEHIVRQNVESENAKLRELVLYMWDFSCVVPDEPHASKEELDYSVEVLKRMRELGVEAS